MKLTREQTKLHDEGLSIVRSGGVLTHAQKLFVVENYHPAASHNVSKSGAFFTPYDLAESVAIIGNGGGRIVDACAGIGVLSFALSSIQENYPAKQKAVFTCIEQNPEYVEVGKAVLPEAEWLCGDIFDILPKLPAFDSGLSNPPFAGGSTPLELRIAAMLAEKTLYGAMLVMPDKDYSVCWDRLRNSMTRKFSLTKDVLNMVEFSSVDWRGGLSKVSVFDLSPDAEP